VEIKNRLLDIRMILGFKYAKDFAIYLGVTPSQLSLWENNQIQPEYIKMIELWEKIRQHEKAFTVKLDDIRLNEITIEKVFYRTA
jgi:putative transcriptional regulator